MERDELYTLRSKVKIASDEQAEDGSLPASFSVGLLYYDQAGETETLLSPADGTATTQQVFLVAQEDVLNEGQAQR